MPRDICYYDGQCGMCQRTVRTLRALDWFHRLEIKDMAGAADLPVPIEVAMTGMPMKTRDGRTLVGFAAVRRAMAQTVGAPLAWILYVPGVSFFAERVYRVIARNRRRSCPSPTQP